MQNKTDLKFLIILGTLAIISTAISLWARWIPLFPGDLQIIYLLQASKNSVLDFIMVWTSFLFGDWHAAILVIPTMVIIARRFSLWEGLAIGAAGAFSLINDLFKILINRPRPSPEQVQVIGTNHGNGFPSGHTFFATIFLGILAYILFIHLHNRWLKIFFLVILVSLILLVGISRVYLGAHWPSDVLGGYIIGSLFLVLLIRTYTKVRRLT